MQCGAGCPCFKTAFESAICLINKSCEISHMEFRELLVLIQVSYS